MTYFTGKWQVLVVVFLGNESRRAESDGKRESGNNWSRRRRWMASGLYWNSTLYHFLFVYSWI